MLHIANPHSKIAVVEELEVDVGVVRAWLADLLWQDDEPSPVISEIYRLKGTLAIRGSDSVHILQAVHETFEIEPSRTLSWARGEPRLCKLVVIGKGIDEREIRRGLRRCCSGLEEEEESTFP